jgi:diaminopimelate decarboxylase
MKMAQVKEQYGLLSVPVVGSDPVPIKTNKNDNNPSKNRTEKLRNKYEQICDNILCPDIATLALTEKPAMEVVNHLLVTVTDNQVEEEEGKQPKQRREPLFQIPEYFSVPSLSFEQQQEERNENYSLNRQLPRVQSFCDRIGYPVLVKGEQHGATFCYSWSSVATTLSLYSSSSSSCFVQKYIEGVEKTIAFAAVDGVLTGAVMMTKAIITPEGKVWSGRLSAVDTEVMRALKSFVHSSHWTGGGELEFIETTPSSIAATGANNHCDDLHHPKNKTNKKNWFLIDFNPRFPSWIFACVYINNNNGGNDNESDSCCNLVADLVKQAIEFKKNKQQRKIRCDYSSSITNEDQDRTRLDRYLGLSAVSFTKSVIELPDLNYSTGIFGKNWMSRFYQSLSSSSGSVVMGKYGEKSGGGFGGGGGGAVTVTVKDNRNSNNKQKNSNDNKNNCSSSHCKDNDPLSPHTPHSPPLDEPSSSPVTTILKELREALASISNLIMKSESGSSGCSSRLPLLHSQHSQHSQHNKNSASNGFIVLGNENLKNNTESKTTICDSSSSTTTPVAVAPLNTPCYLILSDIIRSALSRHKSFISRAIERTALVSPAPGSLPLLPPLSLSLCVSVKTQPMKEVLRLAREFGYSAECISLAEVKAALEAGFSEEEIVLTGPGKFWTAGNDEKELLMNYCQENKNNNDKNDKKDSHSHVLRSSRGLSFTFGAIFADSVMDLFRLLQRINDPTDWLKTKLLGIRFQPAGLQGTPSRFGINGGDPIVLRLVAGLIRHYLPSNIQLGVQFHYAITAPNNGIKKWIGMTESFLILVKELSELSGRSVEVIDFGGGWQPSFSLEDEEEQLNQDKEKETDPISRSFSSSSSSSSSSFFSNELTSLFDFLRKNSSSAPCVPKDNNKSKTEQSFLTSSSPSASPLVVVQFELGKCITERSGFLLCRVMEIREIQFFHDPKSLEVLSNCDNNNINDKKSFDTAFQSFLLSSSTSSASFSSSSSSVCSSSTIIPKGRRAIVIDGSIAEISSPHFHPIFWKSCSYFSSPSSSSNRPTDSVTGSHTDSHTGSSGWQSFAPGEDEIWGRTCMEFDQIVGRVSAWGTGSGRTGMGSQCIAVPLEIKVGDFVLIGNCGSYDMSMSFGFADGQGRKENCRVVNSD